MILLPWKWEGVLKIETDTKEKVKWQRGEEEAKQEAESYNGKEHGEGLSQKL